MIFEDALRHWCSTFCHLSGDQIAVLSRHYELLVRWNRRLNLTAVIDPEEAARKHYAESIFLAIHLPPDAVRIADIGSGAGFPGFPVAVVCKNTTVTLVEADTRKAAFLNECRDMAPNINVVNRRADQLSTGCFDTLVSRAVNLAEIEALVLAPRAFALASCIGSTWNIEARLPWDDKSCVISRETDKL
jgi:16S rRNA (guanine527-N7)-methyltransferase